MNTATRMNKEVRALDVDNVNIMRLNILLQQGVTAIIANTVISLITAIALYSAMPGNFIVGWAVMSVLISVMRLMLVVRLKRKLQQTVSSSSAQSYENLYASFLMVSGLIWGSLGWLFDSGNTLNQQMIIPLVIGGMSAGAVFSHLSSMRSFSAFVIPMILPVSAAIFMAGFQLESLTTLVYLFAVLLLTKTLHQRLLESLTLRHENASLVAHLTDINKSQSILLQELREKEAFLVHTFEQAGVPMIIMDEDFFILDVNNVACELFGYDKKILTQITMTDLLQPDDSFTVSAQYERLLAGDINQFTTTSRCFNKAGKTIWLQATLSSVRNETGGIEYIVVQAQDRTQQRQLHEDLKHQSSHDTLTGLPNRSSLETYLQKVVNDRPTQEHIFCFIDLDQFKVINDTCGHIAGDTLLKQVSTLIQKSLYEADLLARFGGDEFALLMVDCSLQQAQQKLHEILQEIRQLKFSYDGYSFTMTASIGLVEINTTSSLVELLKQADSACYAAKEAGRDRLHLFSDDDSQLAQRSDEMRWVSRIQSALNQQKLVLYSQPIQSVTTTQHHTHRELLIRMVADDGSVISPGKFLPAAERYNLAAAIDMWTIEHVVTRLSQAAARGQDITGIYAINLSGQSLGDARFYEKIIALIMSAELAQTGAVLCFEVTETAAITNIQTAVHFIDKLRQVGCLFALDDFGSGLSSFAYLKQLPVDYLKIDGMFVRDAATNHVNMEIVNSINGIGKALGLQTVAEFVEDNATLKIMQQLGVDYVQGYEIGKPQLWQL